MYGPAADLLIALCWVPLFVLGHVLSAGHGAHNDAQLRQALSAAFLVSFLHQPLTLGLVYGDGSQFRQRRRLFVVAPPVIIGLVVLAVALHLWILIPIAALWNTEHTIQQRYGLSRIYARKAGYGSAFLDRWILYSWMTVAALFVAANRATPHLVSRVGLDGVNAGGVRLLTAVRPAALALLVPVGLAAVALTVAVVRQEVLRARPCSETVVKPANPAKWLYQGSSVVLIAALALDPAAGFIAYVGAHALEYFVVVYKTSEKRFGAGGGSGLLGRVGRNLWGRVAVLGGSVVVALVAHARLHGNAFNVVLYTVGALHFLYDSVIWKLRKPAVAADFAIRGAGTRAGAGR
jgi:hypothetical protein